MEKIKTDCELEILKPKFLTGRDHDIGLKSLKRSHLAFQVNKISTEIFHELDI